MIKHQMNYIKPKSRDKNDLHDQWLNTLPLDHPSVNFTDQVMATLEESPARSVVLTPNNKTTISYVRREFLHGLTAALSTYLFIQSGLMSKLITLDVIIFKIVHFIEGISL